MTRSDSDSSSRSGPLSHITVLDLTQILAGPFATMILADLGADVIKIESPDGDLVRGTPPFLEDDDAFGGYFQSINRNKRSVALDLKTERGRGVLLRLVEDVDVVVENFRVGVMDRLGVSYERLREVNRGLVYASIRGFGDPRLGESPYAERPAFDVIAQAMGGLMSVTGTEESGPVKVGPGIGDIFPAVLNVIGILAALQHREISGEGQYVDVGMIDSVLSLCERIVYQYSFSGEAPGPQGNSHPLFFPFDRFEASDGYVMIAALRDHQWEGLCEMLDRPDWVVEYSSNADRQANAEMLREEINAWTSSFSKGELFEMLADSVPCGPVNTVEDIFQDPHFEAREMLPTVDHAGTGSAVQIAGSPIKFSETPSGVRSSAPFLGGHTREVLLEYGFDWAEIDEFLDAGVAIAAGDQHSTE